MISENVCDLLIFMEKILYLILKSVWAVEIMQIYSLNMYKVIMMLRIEWFQVMQKFKNNKFIIYNNYENV